ncbi:MAG: hypothetical protein K0U84_12155 [Actinomycetia bacterium]|nr:hypothetical protein [Actinomycetes bacterium]
MNDIDRWLERTASKRNRTVSLYSSLLSGRIFQYFRYRLRYPLLLATARFLVHAAEFVLLLSTLGGLATFTVMILRIGSVIIGGGWWGFLEIMRERLRTFAQSGNRDAAQREVGSWLVLAVILAVILTIVAGVVVILTHPSGPDPIANLYAFLIVVELAISLPVRVLHSGIFATRRVYRPIASMFAPIVAQLAVLGVGFYFYPEAAIIIAITVSNGLGIWITVHYVLRAYKLTGLRPRYGTTARNFLRRLPKFSPWDGFMEMLSGVALRLDAVLVLGIVGFYGTATRSFDLTAGFASWRNVDAFEFFYLILPLFRGSYEGAGIFYFDFVRMRTHPALRIFRVYFFHKLLLVSPLIALFYWSLAAGLGLFYLHGIPLSFLLALIPLFVVRTVIGIYQMRMFAEGRFHAHLATTALLAAFLWLVWIDANPASDLVEITAAMIAQLIVLINLQHFRDRRPPPLPTLLTLNDWMHTLARESEPVLVGSVAITESVVPQQRSAAIALMQRTFDGKGHLAFRSSTTLLFFQRSVDSDSDSDSDSEQESLLALQTITGGAVNRATALPRPATNGRDARDRIVAGDWIPPVYGSPPPETVEALIAEFRRLFADGLVFDLQTREGAQDMRGLEQNVLATALPRAIASLEDGANVVRASDRWLTPIYRWGRLRLLLFMPADPDQASFKSWLHTVKSWNSGQGSGDPARRVDHG